MWKDVRLKCEWKWMREEATETNVAIVYQITNDEWAFRMLHSFSLSVSKWFFVCLLSANRWPQYKSRDMRCCGFVSASSSTYYSFHRIHTNSRELQASHPLFRKTFRIYIIRWNPNITTMSSNTVNNELNLFKLNENLKLKKNVNTF